MFILLVFWQVKNMVISQLWLVASCLFSSWSFSVILSQSRYSGVRADDTVVYLSDGTFSYSKLLQYR